MYDTDTTVGRLFVTGLRDVHAVEHQALALMDRQIDRLEHYPDVAAKLREHRRETEVQIERLDTILADLGESASGIKDTALSISGNMAAITHSFAPDEIMKNSFANYAFENFESAAYSALITMGEGQYDPFLQPLRETLAEEERMAEWFRTNQPMVVRQYIALRESGDSASR
jgi:ferritin-like metal-binding protein YciE